jgi:phosphoglycolate phosphatase
VAVIIALDLDGTLIDSARDIAESISEMLQDYGGAPVPIADVVQMVGEGAPILVRRALERSGLHPKPEEALARFLKIYDRRSMDHTVPYDGVAESLALALRRGPLAVLTNKPLGPSIGILEALGMRGYFSRIIGGDSEYGRKPDPAGLMSLQALAPGDQIVMVGDSPADWKTAAAAQVPFVFARYGFGASKFGENPPRTEFVIDHARDLDWILGTIRLKADATTGPAVSTPP